MAGSFLAGGHVLDKEPRVVVRPAAAAFCLWSFWKCVGPSGVGTAVTVATAALIAGEKFLERFYCMPMIHQQEPFALHQQLLVLNTSGQ
jgi:hypothetical protein